MYDAIVKGPNKRAKKGDYAELNELSNEMSKWLIKNKSKIDKKTYELLHTLWTEDISKSAISHNKYLKSIVEEQKETKKEEIKKQKTKETGSSSEEPNKPVQYYAHPEEAPEPGPNTFRIGQAKNETDEQYINRVKKSARIIEMKKDAITFETTEEMEQVYNRISVAALLFPPESLE